MKYASSVLWRWFFCFLVEFITCYYFNFVQSAIFSFINLHVRTGKKLECRFSTERPTIVNEQLIYKSNSLFSMNQQDKLTKEDFPFFPFSGVCGKREIPYYKSLLAMVMAKF